MICCLELIDTGSVNLESILPMEALEAFLKKRDLDENKLRLLLEKGQTLMFENPPDPP